MRFRPRAPCSKRSTWWAKPSWPMPSTRSGKPRSRSFSRREATSSSRSKTTRRPSTPPLPSCSKSSLFPPPPTAQNRTCQRERNRSRREIRALRSQETTPQTVCFPGGQQIAELRRRVRRNGKLTDETVYLISSRSQAALPASDLAALKRRYWKIESALHYRLDEVLDEDRSRVRTPKAAHLLGMFRRLAVSLTIPWLAQKKQTRKRASTRDFHDHLRANNARRAHLLVSAAVPTAWLP